MDLLNPAKENVQRAIREFDKMSSVVNEYVGSNLFSITTFDDGDLLHIISNRDRELSEDIAFDCVDIVLRLRAALDKAFVALVELNTGNQNSKLGFPFGGFDRNTGLSEDFPSGRMTKKGGHKDALSLKQWDFIESLKPYRGGNNALWAVNEIANQDKHKKNLVRAEPELYQRVAIGSGIIDTLLINPNNFQHLLRNSERQKILISLGKVARLSNIHHNISVKIVFGDDLGLHDQDILIVIKNQIEIVDKIISDMSSFFE